MGNCVQRGLKHLFFVLVFCSMQANAQSADTVRLLQGFSSWEACRMYFSGKPTLITFWGTGCKPCIQQFADHHDFMDSLCTAMGIARLYLSVDYDPDEDSLYRAIIYRYPLNGSHLGPHPKDPFRLSVFETFFPLQGNARIVAIPRYVLMGADGQILVPDLPKPRDRKLLVDALRDAL